MLGIMLGYGEIVVRELIVCHTPKISKSWISSQLKLTLEGCVSVCVGLGLESGVWVKLANREALANIAVIYLNMLGARCTWVTSEI